MKSAGVMFKLRTKNILFFAKEQDTHACIRLDTHCKKENFQMSLLPLHDD